MSNRIKLLNLQNILHNQHCVTCPNRNDRNAKSCKKCDIFIQFNEIGNSLLNLNKRQNIQAPRKKNKNDILAESMTEHGMILTIDRYLDLQEMGLKNFQIAEYYGITTQELNEWKVWQGVTSKCGPVSKNDLACSS
ncbi:hypothetical protein [Lysinibacillus parviboronicapiens]|uniref:hypothetical protein n=1 Tax=Lysinibacillus parviboronicapiens TaxID=436516 RepID=UPI000D35439C|nr:hypothetical protein [Lysinibacillus parviboronicapiens]